MRSSAVKIGSGPIDRSTIHRAIAVARELHAAGIWDGESDIYINEPYKTHDLMFGVRHVTARQLAPSCYKLTGKAEKAAVAPHPVYVWKGAWRPIAIQ